jgi:ATP phosphoribosyltransferase
MVGLKMNVPKERFDAVLEVLPSITAPTVSDLYSKDWVSVETVMFEREARDLIPQLVKRGAVGIIEYPLNKVI